MVKGEGEGKGKMEQRRHKELEEKDFVRGPLDGEDESKWTSSLEI